MKRIHFHDQNPSSTRKPTLAFHFLRALSNLTATSRLRRSRSIRRAAYASMARAGGPRRVWSRALLRRRTGVVAKKSVRGSESRTDVLRRLVPGGERMDLCRLLEETASYVQCLGAQVELMQTVADLVSEEKGVNQTGV